MIKLAIIFALHLCARSQDYYDERNEWIGNFTADLMGQDLERSLEYVETRRMMGEVRE